jgi:threonine/homoserine efflux transporter RhtA
MSAGWSPAAVTSARIALAAVLMAPAVAVLRPGPLRFRRGDLWPLLSYGLLGVVGVQLFFFVAVAGRSRDGADQPGAPDCRG